MLGQRISCALSLLIGFVVLGFPQQGQDGEIKNALLLIEERFQKLALIDSVWERTEERLPDPYYQQNWEELAEKHLQGYLAHLRSLGFPELPPEAVEDARKAYRELYLELAKGFRRKVQISIEGGQSLVLATAVLSDKPKYVAKVFIFPDRGCFLEYAYGWGGRPEALIYPMDKAEPIFSELPTRWFFIGGNIVKWGNYRIYKIERQGDEVNLKCLPPGQDNVPPEHQQIVEIRLSVKYGGAPLSVVWKVGQRVVSSLQSKGFRKVGELWLPIVVTETGERFRSEYRLISARRASNLSKVFTQLPLNVIVNDIRLGEDKQVNYLFRGQLPDKLELERMWQDRQKELRQFRAQGIAKGIGKWLPPLFLIVLGVIWYLRMRRR